MRALLVAAVAVAALAALAAALPNCIDSSTTTATVNSGDTNMVCFGDCKKKPPVCFPTPASNKYTETIFFTTFAEVDGSTVWNVNIHVDDSSYLANFSTGATVITSDATATMVTHTTGSDGIVGHPFNSSVFVVSGQWTGHVTVVNMDTHTQFEVASKSVGQVGTGYGSYHMLVTTDLSNVLSPTFGKWWLITFSGKYGGPILPEVPTGWWLSDDGTFGPPNFKVFSVVGDDLLITQIVEVPSTGKNFYIYTSAPPGGGGYYGFATIDFTNGIIATTRIIPGAPFTDQTGFLGPSHGAFYDTFTQDVLMFGSGSIAQVEASDPLAPTFGRLKTVYQVPLNNIEFDQGAPDGRGHVFIADNHQEIVWLSYIRSKDISHPDAQGIAYTMPYLDDVAPLLGSGRVCPISLV